MAEVMNKKLSEYGKIDRFAWGVGITSDNVIVNVATGLREAKGYDKMCAGKKITDVDVSVIREELRAVAADRYAPWPTVRKYLATMK